VALALPEAPTGFSLLPATGPTTAQGTFSAVLALPTAAPDPAAPWPATVRVRADAAFGEQTVTREFDLPVPVPPTSGGGETGAGTGGIGTGTGGEGADWNADWGQPILPLKVHPPLALPGALPFLRRFPLPPAPEG
jgi:hypothetical protein